MLKQCFLHFPVAWKIKCNNTPNTINLELEDDTVVYYVVLLNSNICASGVFSVDQNWEQTRLSLLEA